MVIKVGWPIGKQLHPAPRQFVYSQPQVDGQSAKDRYLDNYPDFGRIIVLTRFDLKRKTFNARHVNVDVGPSYLIYTDDMGTLIDLGKAEAEKSIERDGFSTQEIRRVAFGRSQFNLSTAGICGNV